VHSMKQRPATNTCLLIAGVWYEMEGIALEESVFFHARKRRWVVCCFMEEQCTPRND
jgi:hypothetical protein